MLKSCSFTQKSGTWNFYHKGCYLKVTIMDVRRLYGNLRHRTAKLNIYISVLWKLESGFLFVYYWFWILTSCIIFFIFLFYMYFIFYLVNKKILAYKYQETLKYMYHKHKRHTNCDDEILLSKTFFVFVINACSLNKTFVSVSILQLYDK